MLLILPLNSFSLFLFRMPRPPGPPFFRCVFKKIWRGRPWLASHLLTEALLFWMVLVSCSVFFCPSHKKRLSFLSSRLRTFWFSPSLQSPPPLFLCLLMFLIYCAALALFLANSPLFFFSLHVALRKCCCQSAALPPPLFFCGVLPYLPPANLAGEIMIGRLGDLLSPLPPPLRRCCAIGGF